MKTTTIGLDLAKNVFQVHGVNERGVAVLRKVSVRPAAFLSGRELLDLRTQPLPSEVLFPQPRRELVDL